MLPNHAPIIIAEQFGALARLFPDRIDLGVGRAPGTDQATARALRRGLSSVDGFPDDVRELRGYFQPPGDRQVQAVPAGGTNVPVWMLGSSTYGARLAAEFGLPYAFASHFAPSQLMEALALYRAGFKPSAQLAKPYAVVGVNIVAAETDARARRLATTQQMSMADLFRGGGSLGRPPIDDIDTYWSASEKAHASVMLGCSIIGAPGAVKTGVAELIDATGADELMIISDIYDHAERLRSYALIAEVAGAG